MVAENSYIFGDLLTGQIIEEIRLQSVSFKHTFDSGEFRGTFYLDQSGKDNSVLLAATTPGRTYVVVERDGHVIGDFIVWNRTYQSQAKVFQIYGIPFKDYTESRLVDSDYAAYDKDQRQILVDLYALMQSDPNSIRVELPSPFSTTSVLKTVEVWADEKKTFRQVMDSLADAEDGFDWLIRTERNAEGTIYRRFLDIGYPQLGAAPNGAEPTFSYHDDVNGSGGNIINYWCNDSMGSAATNFYGVGAGDGGNMVTSDYIHTDLLANGFPRYDATVDYKDIDDESMLTKLVQRQANLLKAPFSLLTVEVKADLDPAFGTYNLGDACVIQIRDPRFPDTLTRATRIFGWEYYPPDDENVEYVRLTFEGEEYSNG